MDEKRLRVMIEERGNSFRYNLWGNVVAAYVEECNGICESQKKASVPLALDRVTEIYDLDRWPVPIIGEPEFAMEQAYCRGCAGNCKRMIAILQEQLLHLRFRPTTSFL